MYKPSKKSIFILIIFGTGLAIIFLEIALNIIPPMIYKKSSTEQQSKKTAANNFCRIVCLGDSFTYGLGADPDKSYPAQLQEILNKNNPEKLFEVQNLGTPGETSSKTLIKLEKVIKQYHPDIVIILSGVNDTWSLSEYWKFKVLKSIQQLNLFTLNLKFFKLIDLIVYNLKTPIPLGSDISLIIKTANNLRDVKKYKQAEAYYQQALLIDPRHLIALLELGRCQRLNKQFNAAGLTFEKAFVLDPKNETIHSELSDLFIKQKNIPQEVALLLRLKNSFPDNMYLIQRLCYVYSILGEPYFSSNLAKKITDRQAKTPGAISLTDAELALLESYYSDNIAYNKKNKAESFWNNFLLKTNKSTLDISEMRYLNFEKIAKLCEKENVSLIFSGYPSIFLEEMKSAAEKYSIPLIDHRHTFYNLLQEHSPREFFVSEFDRHCTAAGYRVIAENIANEVLKIVSH